MKSENIEFFYLSREFIEGSFTEYQRGTRGVWERRLFVDEF